MKYELNQRSMLRYQNNVAEGLYYIYPETKRVSIYDEQSNLVWYKNFKKPIISVTRCLGNFSTVSEQIQIITSDNKKIVYSTNGSLLYESHDDVYFDNYYEEFKARVLFSNDVEVGYYCVSFEVENNNDNKIYEIFDTRGMCIYEGVEKSVTCVMLVLENELLQLKTRDNIDITNVTIEHTPQQSKVVVVGDSTLTNQSLPFWGWPQLLQARMGMPVTNFAISARSTKSFGVEGRFERIKRIVSRGDTLIIGFGHNDEKDNYFGTTPQQFITNLNQIVTAFEKLDVEVIITTPIPRRNILDDKLIETHGDYLDMLRAVFSSKLIDTNSFLVEEIEKVGIEDSKQLFVHSDLMKIYDDTHTSYFGASSVCNFFINEYKNISN